ncbi:MAG: Maf family protein [Sphaerochaeta sp.]|uniref:Maf family protein n=1 Tax=unclassified Sphaerochaeta TaxID=2637943 RepID=UPI0025EC7BDC|nr:MULTISPECIES: Maf family protein [unclassified Sphaerochaeta]MCK9599454.1 Maf family protein [Sphaerochaeta sp.]MDX9823513.1 Maf family protein [Sphaerochaeta sp.]MEA4866380.1 Maf family protein [Sphaerochaeta sp.]HPE92892.1 Maf family protein [Sphaerochaeta sp.]
MPELSHMLPRLILASQSVARKALLQELGIEVATCPTHSDETFDMSDPADVVAMLARRKLQAYRKEHPSYTLPVLCCDTLIWFEGKLIGKPVDQMDAKNQLQSFSGKAQQVYSGWALWYENQEFCDADRALVWFKDLDEPAIEAYLETREWEGAAGSYRIQGLGKHLVDRIDGDRGTVIGLPVEQLKRILEEKTSP